MCTSKRISIRLSTITTETSLHDDRVRAHSGPCYSVSNGHWSSVTSSVLHLTCAYFISVVFPTCACFISVVFPNIPYFRRCKPLSVGCPQHKPLSSYLSIERQRMPAATARTPNPETRHTACLGLCSEVSAAPRQCIVCGAAAVLCVHVLRRQGLRG